MHVGDGASGQCVCNDGSMVDGTTGECPGKFTYIQWKLVFQFFFFFFFLVFLYRYTSQTYSLVSPVFSYLLTWHCHLIKQVHIVTHRTYIQDMR